MNDIKLGRAVRDSVTGFSGQVIGVASYLAGSDQYQVQPPVMNDGTFVESRWFDRDRLRHDDKSDSRPGFDS